MSTMAVAVTLKATDKISPVISKINTNLSKMEAKTVSIGKASAKMGAVSLAGFAGIVTTVGSLVNKYQDLAKAQGEVESLGVNAKGIEIITAQAVKFSNTFAGTAAPDFVRASYDIKSGISSLSAKGVAEFTRLAALTGKATKSTTTQMTSFFATGYGIYAKQFDALASKTIAGWKNLSQEEKDIKFGETFASGIASAVQMFKTTGSQMQGAIETLGATATTSNVPLTEQLAILGSMQKSFASGSEAATAYKGFLSGAVNAQQKLNLRFVDHNNQLISAPKILEKLRRKYGNTLDDIEKADIKKAFGTEEGMKFITAFYGEIDELKTSIDGMDRSIAKGTDGVITMAMAMNKGMEFELLSQKTDNLMTVIGKQFAPVALKLATTIGDITTKVTEWASKNQETVSTITSVVTVAGAALGTFGALAMGISAVSFAFSPLLKIARVTLGLLGSKSIATTISVKALDGALRGMSGKSYKSALDVTLPNKTTMIGKLSSLMGSMAKYVVANPLKVMGTLALGVAAVAGAKAMSEAQHTQIIDKRQTKDQEALKAKIARIEERIKSMKSSAYSIDGIGERLLNGSVNKHTIAQQEKLLARAKANLAKVSQPKTTEVPKPVVAKKIESKEAQRPISNAKIEPKQAVNKTINNHKKVDVHAPINITIHSVEGKVPADQIAGGVKSAVESASHKANQNTKFEDQE